MLNTLGTLASCDHDSALSGEHRLKFQDSVTGITVSETTSYDEDHKMGHMDR